MRKYKRSAPKLDADDIHGFLANSAARETESPPWTPSSPSRVNRSTVVLMQERMEASDAEDHSGFEQGAPVTHQNIYDSMVVARGRHWNRGNDDGGAGKMGVVLLFDKKSKTCTIFWQETGVVQANYRIGNKQDLVEMRQAQKEYCDDLDASLDGRRRPSKEGGITTSTSSFAYLKDMFSSAVKSALPARRNYQVTAVKNVSRDSQATFRERGQTAIVFDWDDTLFPTTWAFNAADGPKLICKPMAKQYHLPPDIRSQCGKSLMGVAMAAAKLLRLAHTQGKVIIVTLAARGWVTDVCKYFYPVVGQALRELEVTIVYAEEVAEVDHEVAAKLSDSESQILWSIVKGRAITQELKKFYSQYEGQSWKNVISIGDAEFERLGARVAAAEYKKEQGVVGNDIDATGHVINVRIKTFKMIDAPSVEELSAQQDMLHQWLPRIVKKDDHFDANLSAIGSAEELKAIEDALGDPRSTSPTSWSDGGLDRVGPIAALLNDAGLRGSSCALREAAAADGAMLPAEVA